MPTPTYTPLANLTLGSTAASVSFSSISQAYRDLILVLELQSSFSNQALVRFNSDTTNANYPAVVMQGTGSIAESYTQNGIFANAGYLTNRNFTNFNIMDYSATDKHKTVLYRLTNASVATVAYATRWASTSAITSIQVNATSDTFAAGSTFALYGIAS